MMEPGQRRETADEVGRRPGIDPAHVRRMLRHGLWTVAIGDRQ